MSIIFIMLNLSHRVALIKIYEITPTLNSFTRITFRFFNEEKKRFFLFSFFTTNESYFFPQKFDFGKKFPKFFISALSDIM